MRSKTSNQNRLMRIITVPIRVLCKARDFYVRSITDCSNRTVGFQGNHEPLPRSFSVSSSMSNESEDFRELVRAASSRTVGNRGEVDSFVQQQQIMRQSMVMGSRKSVPRSSSVGMGSIDEDRPTLHFGGSNVNLGNREFKYPRSRSYAV